VAVDVIAIPKSANQRN